LGILRAVHLSAGRPLKGGEGVFLFFFFFFFFFFTNVCNKHAACFGERERKRERQREKESERTPNTLVLITYLIIDRRLRTCFATSACNDRRVGLRLSDACVNRVPFAPFLSTSRRVITEERGVELSRCFLLSVGRRVSRRASKKRSTLRERSG
jgi:hypothetical protein